MYSIGYVYNVTILFDFVITLVDQKVLKQLAYLFEYTTEFYKTIESTCTKLPFPNLSMIFE